MNAAQQIHSALGVGLGNRQTPAPKVIGTLVWDSAAEGTYKQPSNNRRLKRMAIREHGFRQFKRKGVLAMYNAARKEESNA